jgi:5'(3')-deoxyribonucleotidase
MTDKPQLALDIDSTLSARDTVARDPLDAEYGYEDVISWDWPLETFGKHSALSALWHAWTLRPMDVPPTEENLSEKVAALHSKYNVHIVTAHPDHPGITEGKQAWLDEHGIGHEDFVQVPMGESKAKLGYDVFIDDKPHLPSRIDDTQTVYLYDQPYNEHAPGDYHRIESITDPLKFEQEITV